MVAVVAVAAASSVGLACWLALIVGLAPVCASSSCFACSDSACFEGACLFVCMVYVKWPVKLIVWSVGLCRKELSFFCFLGFFLLSAENKELKIDKL